MKQRSIASTPEQKRRALYEKAGQPTAQMKQTLSDAFGLLRQESMKDFDIEHYKAKAWRK